MAMPRLPPVRSFPVELRGVRLNLTYVTGRTHPITPDTYSYSAARAPILHLRSTCRGNLRRPMTCAACRLPMTHRLTLSYVELQAPRTKDQALHRPRDVSDETR